MGETKKRSDTSKSTSQTGSNFIRTVIEEDLKSGKHDCVATRFPPEPNGYLHIGHAKALCLNFGLAKEFGGTCNLRFDDTNPSKEEVEFVEAIQRDIQWLGFQWSGLFHASDYFQQLYDYGVQLIREGKAYVCSLSAEKIRESRGTLTLPGKESPYRKRPIAESLDLFERMRQGEFEDGAHVLRLKIDMASGNLNMRDPVVFRIRHADHHRTGSKWCIYPMYDYAHCISDSIEGITHSLCSLEFEDHRPLYDWILDELGVPCHPQQIEFARLNLSYTVMSKRKLQLLVEDRIVSGWNDPRMPTLSGMRRRGYTPEAIRDFCSRIGMAKAQSTVEVELLDLCLREDLNRRAPRRMAVLDPLRVVIENYPEGKSEEFDAINNPESPAMGSRKVLFAREIFIEREDFAEDPPKNFFRLAPGREVRLMHAYYITCTEAVKDQRTGEIAELRCTYDPQSRGATTPDQRKVKGTIHWVSATHAHRAEVRLYQHLFLKEYPEQVPEGQNFLVNLNPNSIQKCTAALEPTLANAAVESKFQFLRQGYFSVDPVDSSQGKPVFNRITPLRSTWAKAQGE